MFRSWWQKMTCGKTRFPARTRRAKPLRARQRTVSLEIQALEDRCLPTVLINPVFSAEQLLPTPIGDYHYQTLSSPSVYLIFWGTYWNNNGSQVQTTANDFQTIMSSPFTSGLTRYGSDGKAVYVSYYVDKYSDPPAGFNSHDSSQASIIQTEIGNVINNLPSGIPAPPLSGDAIYVVITSNVNNGNGNGSYNAPGVYQAGIFPFPMSMISVGYDGSPDDTNVVFAHELAEAMSDPSGNGNTFGVRVAPTASPAPGRGGRQICDWEPGEYGYRLGGPSGVYVPSYWYNATNNSGNFTFGGTCIVPDGNAQQLVLQAVPGSWSQDSTGTIVFNHHYDLTIRGDQLGQNYNDTLVIAKSSAGLQVTLNGESFFFDANIDIVDNIYVDLGGGTNSLTLDDTNAPMVGNINIYSDRIDGFLSTAPIYFIDTPSINLNLQGGNGRLVDLHGGPTGDTWTLRDDGNGGASFQSTKFAETFDVAGLEFPDRLNLDTAGSDTVNVQGVPLPLSPLAGSALVAVNLGAGTNVVNVTPFDQASSNGGQAQNLDFIRGSLTVNGGAGTNTLSLDDMAIPFASAWDVGGTVVTRVYRPESGGILGPPVFRSVNYTGINDLVIDTGTGTNSIELSPIAHNLDELPHSEILGLFSYQGSVTVNGGGADTLILDDQNQTNASTWTVTGSSVTRAYYPGLFEQVSAVVNYTGIADLVMNDGSGGNTIRLSPTVQNLDELPHSEILGLFSYQGSVTVNGGGADTLILDDQNQTNASTWTVTGSSVTRAYYPGLFEQVSAIVNYSGIASLVMNAGSGGNTITLSPTAQNLDELPHSTTVLGFTSVGSVTVNGGGADTLVLDDQNNSNASTWTAARNNVTRSYTTVVGGLVPETITSSVNYSGFANLVLNAGSGGNTITLSPTAQDLDGLPHTTSALGFTSAGSVTVHGGGSDALILDDQNNPQHSIWAVSAGSVARSYTTVVGGLFPETITAAVNYSGLASLTLSGGTGGNTFNVQSTAAGTATTINSTGPDAVNVGNSTDGVGDIQGSLSITNNPAAGDYTALSVDDSAYRRGYWASMLTPSGLTTNQRVDNGNQVSVAPINFVQSDLSSLNILLGNSPGGSGNIVSVVNTPTSGHAGGLMTTITTGISTPGDVIYVGATTGPLTANLIMDWLHVGSSLLLGSATHTLDNIRGPVTVNTPAGWTGLALYDDGSTIGHTYTVTKNTIAFRPNLPVITYHVNNEVFLYAGSGVNTVNVESQCAATLINAGLSGKDTINVGGPGNTLQGVVNDYLYFQIDKPGSHIYLNDQGNSNTQPQTYTIGMLRAGVAEVVGAAGDIVFSGPLGALTLNASNGNDTFAVQALWPSPTHLAIKGGIGTNTLVGPNITNNWVVSGINSGSLDQTVSFSAVQNLVGGAGVDVFKLTPAGKISSINGGGAPAGQGDWLDYSPWTTPVTVNLATGAASNVNGGAAGAVTNIQDVHGGNGGNTLTGNAQGNILIGGAGADTIIGGTGRSLLIGDKGADHITGGSGGLASGGDILIGGTTIWDSDSNAHFQALMSILAEWQSGNSYATRVSHLRLGGGLNGSNKLIWGTTVKDDGVANVLTAATSASSPAVDWFFTGVFDTAMNTEAGEAHNNGTF